MGWLVGIGLLVVAVALGAYPIARRLTRRLERLQRRVEALGAGELTARVEVEGHDEVADLARSFNRAADRIAHLVTAQRTVLAGASHELRSPLTRMRMAVNSSPILCDQRYAPG
jgi:methyl-accepting chemotaxis protein